MPEQEWQWDMDAIARMAANQKAQPLAARFYVDAVQNDTKSAAEGRPVFEDMEMIEIVVDRNDIRQRPATPEDIQQYPALYLAFKQGQSQEAAEGTPLREWPPVKRSQAESLVVNGIRTVEQLAAASDAKLQQVGPLLALRQKARDWLEEAQRGAGVSKLRAENDALVARVQALEQMVTEQSAQLAEARKAGGVLTTQGPDPRMSALEAQLAALAKRLEPSPAPPEAPKPKRRGRPPGSKNKPKNGADVPTT